MHVIHNYSFFKWKAPANIGIMWWRFKECSPQVSPFRFLSLLSYLQINKELESQYNIAYIVFPPNDPHAASAIMC
jgi:hypothetical protein